MTWWAVDVRPSTDAREWLGAWLVGRTGHAVEERDDGTLVGFASDEGAADQLIAALRREGGAGVHASRRALEEIDWSTRWREGLGPRQFGRLSVVPSWLGDTHIGGPLRLVLDPEMAFGSGEHGSTRAALVLLERLLRPNMTVLDLGSGSGILAIAAVLLGAARAVGIEIDAEANEVADRNAARNRVADRTVFVAGDAGVLAPLLGPADLLLANILRTINTALLPSIRLALSPKALAVFSGLEEAEAPLFRAVLAKGGFAVLDEVVDAGWWAAGARLA